MLLQQSRDTDYVWPVSARSVLELFTGTSNLLPGTRYGMSAHPSDWSCRASSGRAVTLRVCGLGGGGSGRTRLMTIDYCFIECRPFSHKQCLVSRFQSPMLPPTRRASAPRRARRARCVFSNKRLLIIFATTAISIPRGTAYARPCPRLSPTRVPGKAPEDQRNSLKILQNHSAQVRKVCNLSITRVEGGAMFTLPAL